MEICGEEAPDFKRLETARLKPCPFKQNIYERALA
jgi:hypothetical protein